MAELRAADYLSGACICVAVAGRLSEMQALAMDVRLWELYYWLGTGAPA